MHGAVHKSKMCAAHMPTECTVVPGTPAGQAVTFSGCKRERSRSADVAVDQILRLEKRAAVLPRRAEPDRKVTIVCPISTGKISGLTDGNRLARAVQNVLDSHTCEWLLGHQVEHAVAVDVDVCTCLGRQSFGRAPKQTQVAVAP